MDINFQVQNSLSSVPNNDLPKSPTNNLDISAATYLGGSEDDYTDAVDISLDGNFVIVGGSLKNAKLGGKETELLGGGDGTIIRYDSQTNQAVTTTRLPGRVLDLEVSNNGDIAVAYEGGIAVLNADATEVKWSKSLSDVSRVAISDAGKVGVVRDIKGGDRAYLFDSNGEQLQEWSTKNRRQFNDIAVTDQNGGMVIATGFEQKTSILQVAFTRAWSYEGENLWKNYDFDDRDIYKENLLADTRGQRVAIGRDGQLYASYYVNGGTGFSIFYRDPNDLTQKLTDERKIETDKYNSPSNVGSIKMLWYGRYDLKNGDLIKGQSLLGRLGNGKGNSVGAESITATKDGTVIIAGDAAAGIANRDEQTIEGQGVSEYTPYDGHIAIISPDLTERLSWTPISDSNGGVVAAVRDGKIAAVTTTDFAEGQITHNAIQESAGGNKDGYLLVVGGNDAPVETAPTIPQDNPQQSLETEAENKNLPSVNKQKVDISLPILTNGSDNSPTVNKREVEISQPILEIETGSDNSPTEDKQEVESSQPVLETETGSDNIPPVNKQEVDISKPVFEGGKENPYSIFPRGLIDLTKIDLYGDRQPNNRVFGKFSDIGSKAGYDNFIQHDTITNINRAVEDILTGEAIAPEKQDNTKVSLNQRGRDLEFTRNRGSFIDRFFGGIMESPFFSNDMLGELMEQDGENQSSNFSTVDSNPFDSNSFDFNSLGVSTDNLTNEDIPQIGKQFHLQEPLCGSNNGFDDFWTKFNIESSF